MSDNKEEKATLPEDELTDESAALRVGQGDVAAFGVLMRRYEPKLLRYANKFLLGREDAEDLVQDVFLKAYVNIRSFDSDRRFSPWIYRIAHNEFVGALRRRSGERLTFFDFDTLLPQLSAKGSADDVARRHELRDRLERHLSRLPDKYREPVVLYYFEELSYQEIAEALRLPVPTVGVRLNRAKALLKRQLEDNRTKYE